MIVVLGLGKQHVRQKENLRRMAQQQMLKRPEHVSREQQDHTWAVANANVVAKKKLALADPV